MNHYDKILEEIRFNLLDPSTWEMNRDAVEDRLYELISRDCLSCIHYISMQEDYTNDELKIDNSVGFCNNGFSPLYDNPNVGRGVFCSQYEENDYD